MTTIKAAQHNKVVNKQNKNMNTINARQIVGVKVVELYL